jgi:hypothetical protein
MVYWVWYRKSSFVLKEQFDCHRLASSRASDLIGLVGTVEVVDPGRTDGRIHALLKHALEFDAAAGRLILFGAPPKHSANDDLAAFQRTEKKY